MEGFLALRPALYEDLNRLPPQYLVCEIDRLLSLEADTTNRLRDYLATFAPGIVPAEILSLFDPNAESRELQRVQEVRGSHV